MNSETANLLAIVGDFFSRMFDRLAFPTLETFYMVGVATIFSLFVGMALAVLMIIIGPRGLSPVPKAYKAIDAIINLLRSFPFIILIVFMTPFTRIIVGTYLGSTATILPLTCAAVPFVARIMEASLLEVDRGVVEAARSFGASNLQIVLKVMIKEALPSITLNVAVVGINLLGYSAMAGAVGGGGIGNVAMIYGYSRFETDTMIVSVILLLILVQLIQMAGNYAYSKLK